MNWDAIGAIAELVGAVGVVASLLYVAAQVRTGNRASAVQAKLETTRLLNDFNDLLIQNPELNNLMLKGRKDLGSLSRDEYLLFSSMSLKSFWFFSAGYFQFRQRTLTDSDWFELRAVIHYWLVSQGCRDWWHKLGRFMFDGDFAAFVEAEFSTLAAQPATVAQDEAREPSGPRTRVSDVPQ